MRAFLFSLLAMVFVATAASAQDADTAIRNTIQNQIEAFRADDFDTAFTFASPNIQGIFVTPDNFGTMVKRGYPMVWRPDTVEFGDLQDRDGGLWQRVIIRDAEGKLHGLDYLMLETADGWKINGVQLVELPGLTV